MGKLDARLMRLLRSAALARTEANIEAPFGFDTRVLARWRESNGSDNGEVALLLRRVAAVALAITLFGGVFAYRQISEDEEIGEPLTNEYAIADSTIEQQFLQ
jgi:hypothetical protein